mgnify:CR=1 FL=1
MADDGFHEIQLGRKQLFFVFLAGTVLLILVFIIGVWVGRGVRKPEAEVAADVPAADAPVAGGSNQPTQVSPGELDYSKLLDAEGIDIGPSPTDAFVAEQLSTPIEQLDMTVRSYNCLKREGIHTVGELLGRSEADLLDIRNFGAKSIDEVKEKLASLGLPLKDSPPGFDPSHYASRFDDDEDEAPAFGATFSDTAEDSAIEDQSFAEDEQL